MRRIVLLATAAALCASALSPATAGAIPPVPTMTATACVANGTTLRVTVTWSALQSTGGQIFVDMIPPEIHPDIVWNQKGKHGTHVEEFLIAGRVIDSVIVNLYNDKIPGFFEQRQLGDDDESPMTLLPC